MKISFVTPHAELQPYIESFWVLESSNGLPATAKSIAAPNGCSKLIIPYDNSIVSVADGRVQMSYQPRAPQSHTATTGPSNNCGDIAALTSGLTPAIEMIYVIY
jgi:Domain of unknown function (DUF6597)